MLPDVFIAGEKIDLCVPTKDLALNSSWYKWFNNPKITRFLYQGLFPNTPDLQLKFFEEESAKRLLLLISNKKECIGVVSLSNVNFVMKTAELAIVVDNDSDVRNSPMLALEAIARISEHAFKIMGLTRISASQHYKLAGWQQRMELLGYKLEGICTGAFVKGNERADCVKIAATYEDYVALVKHRNLYWDSHEKMLDRVHKLPANKFVDQLRGFFESQRERYYSEIFKL